MNTSASNDDASRADRTEHLFGKSESPVPEPAPEPVSATPASDATGHAPDRAGPAGNQHGPGGHQDDDGPLTQLHPNYKLMLRVKAAIFGVILIIAALVAESALTAEFGLPFGALSGPVALFALFVIIRLPVARYNARGYQMGEDRLRVVRGVLFHSDTVVPFGRVQHIDVDQGPVERALDIATMTLHTAGSHNASVSLPGLGRELANDMRETIRAHIRRESV